MKEGWICPKCGRVLAPFIPECPCYKTNEKAQTNKDMHSVLLQMFEKHDCTGMNDIMENELL